MAPAPGCAVGRRSWRRALRYDVAMRFLLLCTDAYGGHGGIALFNRQLVSALAAHPECEQVVVVPRLIVREQEPLPPNVVFDVDAARGKLAYLRAVRRLARERFDVIFCGHI